MDITFLGTGASVVDRSRSNTSLLFSENDRHFMVDCSGSPATALDKAGVRVNDLNYLLLTHVHTDHIYALPSLVHNKLIRKKYVKPEINDRPLVIFGHQQVIDRARDFLAALNLLRRAEKNNVTFETLSYDQHNLNIEGMDVQVFPVDHSVDTFGVQVASSQGKTVVYSCDTAPCEAVIQRVTRADILIHECTSFEDKDMPGHTNIFQMKDIVDNTGVSSVYLVHLPALDKDVLERVISDIGPPYSDVITPAQDNMTVSA